MNFKENLPLYTFTESRKAFLGLNTIDTVIEAQKGALLNALHNSILDRVCKLNLFQSNEKWIESLNDQPVLKMKILLVPVN